MCNKILSIYIPTYNREDKVVRQLNFLLNEVKELEQENIEIIVNDNCSTDNTKEAVLNCIKNTNVIYHRNDYNLGIGGNMYASVKFVTGKYLWVIGDDDVLFPGVVKRVYDILSSYPAVSYIFLNYARLSDPKTAQYDGPSGLIDDGATLMTGSKVDKINVLFLSTASIYLTEGFVKTVEALPLESEENYGVNGCASLVCMKMGKAFFESQVWLNNDVGNISWRNIIYESNMGVLRMFSKLTLFGYNKTEISSIYKSWISEDWVIGKILCRFTITKDIKRYLKDTMFCFRKAPKNVISIYWNLIVNKVKKLFSR